MKHKLIVALSEGLLSLRVSQVVCLLVLGHHHFNIHRLRWHVSALCAFSPASLVPSLLLPHSCPSFPLSPEPHRMSQKRQVMEIVCSCLQCTYFVTIEQFLVHCSRLRALCKTAFPICQTDLVKHNDDFGHDFFWATNWRIWQPFDKSQVWPL
jgi:hypothetical protein